MTDMPHVAFVPFTGFRVREDKLLELGMTLPGLRQRASAVGELPALGLLTLAGMLPEEWTCSYHSCPFPTDELIEEIISEHPTLVAVSALTASITEAYSFCQRMKEENVQVVIGGLHVTTCPLEAKRFCDAVVIGEGEPVWLQVLRDAQSGTLQAEYRAEEIRGVQNWPLPRFELLEQPSRLTVQTQRGCPLACDFCAASRLLGRFRHKPIEHIRQELTRIHDLFGNRPIELADDNTFIDRQDVHDLLDLLEEFNVRYFTEADWRIGERPDILDRLADSGCLQVLMGIESLILRYPGMGAKAVELNRILDAVEAIQESGVAVNGCFIVGAEGETHQSLDRLAEFLLQSPFAEIQLTLQTPFPGTELRKRLLRKGRILEDRDWSFYTLFDLTYHPDTMKVDELEYRFAELLTQVFGNQGAIRRNSIRRNVWRNNPKLHRIACYEKQ